MFKKDPAPWCYQKISYGFVHQLATLTIWHVFNYTNIWFSRFSANRSWDSVCFVVAVYVLLLQWSVSLSHLRRTGLNLNLVSKTEQEPGRLENRDCVSQYNPEAKKRSIQWRHSEVWGTGKSVDIKRTRSKPWSHFCMPKNYALRMCSCTKVIQGFYKFTFVGKKKTIFSARRVNYAS
jgi:hypothetical protein